MIMITLRKFEEKDIKNKVEWINNSVNNQFLHYDLPLQYDKTLAWFKNNKSRTDRYDAVIEVDGVPVGLIGLLSIDRKNRKAEYYISLGKTEYKGKGVAVEASKLMFKYAFKVLGLNKVYAHTEVGNIAAQKLNDKVGLIKEGLLKQEIFTKGKFVDVYAYGIFKGE